MPDPAAFERFKQAAAALNQKQQHPRASLAEFLRAYANEEGLRLRKDITTEEMDEYKLALMPLIRTLDATQILTYNISGAKSPQELIYTDIFQPTALQMTPERAEKLAQRFKSALGLLDDPSFHPHEKVKTDMIISRTRQLKETLDAIVEFAANPENKQFLDAMELAPSEKIRKETKSL